MSMIYLRYTDDMFMTWKGNYDYLINVLHKINKQHPTIKSNFGISKEMVKDKDRNIQTIVYHEETDRQSYLRSKSKYTLRIKKKSIPFS